MDQRNLTMLYQIPVKDDISTETFISDGGTRV